MFKTVAWTSPEAFYEKYIREDEEFAEKNKQIIIDADDEDTDKEPVKLEDVGLEINDEKKHQQDDTNVAFYDEIDRSAAYTIDDLMKEPQNMGPSDIKDEGKRRDRRNLYKDNNKA
jgi:hypothetical protein